MEGGSESTGEGGGESTGEGVSGREGGEMGRIVEPPKVWVKKKTMANILAEEITDVQVLITMCSNTPVKPPSPPPPI